MARGRRSILSPQGGNCPREYRVEATAASLLSCAKFGRDWAVGVVGDLIGSDKIAAGVVAAADR